MSDLAAQFWDALDHQQEWLTRPQVMYDDGEMIWKMTAKEGYLFDDSFWEVFERFPLRICHVSYSGAPWSLEGGPPEMVLRFAVDPMPQAEERWLCSEHDRLGHRTACSARVKVGPCPMIPVLVIPLPDKETMSEAQGCTHRHVSLPLVWLHDYCRSRPRSPRSLLLAGSLGWHLLSFQLFPND